MSTTSQLTVVVLCFNSGDFMDRTISSIRSSSLDNVRVICIDDGSTDDSVANLQRLRETLDFQLVVNERNLGIAATCNVALRQVRTRYISVIGDDEVDPRRFEDDVSLLNRYKSLSWVSSQVRLIDRNSAEIPRSPRTFDRKVGLVCESPALTWFFGPKAVIPTVTYRTSALRAVGGWNESFSIEDKPLFIKFAVAKMKGLIQPHVTTSYRRHDGNFSAVFREDIFLEEIRMLELLPSRPPRAAIALKILIDSHYWMYAVGTPLASIQKALAKAGLRLETHILRLRLFRAMFWLAWKIRQG